MIAATVTLGFHLVFMPDYAQLRHGNVAGKQATGRANPPQKANKTDVSLRQAKNQLKEESPHADWCTH
jgi:hypothetical protein